MIQLFKLKKKNVYLLSVHFYVHRIKSHFKSVSLNILDSFPSHSNPNGTKKNTAKPLLQLVTVINPNDPPTVDHHYGPEMHHIAINNLPFNSSTADMKRRLCHGKSCAI